MSVNLQDSTCEHIDSQQIPAGVILVAQPNCDIGSLQEGHRMKTGGSQQDYK
jgi:hypothetical protein